MEVFFLLGGSLPFGSGVVVSLRPLLVCHAYYWLLTALFPSLSLCLPVPSSPGFLCRVPWVCYLALTMVLRTLTIGPGFLMLPACHSPSIRALGLLVPVATLLH